MDARLVNVRFENLIGVLHVARLNRITKFNLTRAKLVADERKKAADAEQVAQVQG